MSLSFFRTLFYALWLFINLILEIFAAMLVYIYLDLYHRSTFGSLVGIAREILNGFTQNLTSIAPDFANQANTSLLGEFGAKSILLLVIGLVVAAVLRSLTMIIFKAVDSYRLRRIENGQESQSTA